MLVSNSSKSTTLSALPCETIRFPSRADHTATTIRCLVSFKVHQVFKEDSPRSPPSALERETAAGAPSLPRGWCASGGQEVEGGALELAPSPRVTVDRSKLRHRPCGGQHTSPADCLNLSS
ncbi:hypothetical protein Pcinc_021568 [Petrolisthes cinctipes]|uniref:Uncharacterized protein n=1 Tax=Petrolisthes cinctipes TaxID=88211 RepID=A0AAE1KJM0_PETCI|nr:hypothetical protein Pcinc_021568 [Petrolisthes cinctipes]